LQGHNYKLEYDQKKVLSVKLGRNGFIKSTPGRTPGAAMAAQAAREGGEDADHPEDPREGAGTDFINHFRP
jgi:hypothetical protein